MGVKVVEVREAKLVEVREAELAEVSIEVEIDPIRVDTKLDIVETQAEPGTKSRIQDKPSLNASLVLGK